MRYEDIELPLKHVAGYPRMDPVEPHRVLLADWSGRFHVLDLHERSVRSSGEYCPTVMGEPYGVAVCSLSVEPTMRRQCAAVSCGAHCFIWPLDGERVTAFEVATEYPASSVAYTADGRELVIGMGFYPLNPARHSRAHVEKWHFEAGRAVHCMTAALPGVCVHSIMAWDERMLVAASGNREQSRTYIEVLDRDTLRAESQWTIETEFEPIIGAYEGLLIVGRQRVWAYDLARSCRERDVKPRWTWNGAMTEAQTGSPVIDGRNGLLLLPTGDLLDCESGSWLNRLALPRGVRALTAMSSGGFGAITDKGLFRRWVAADR